MFVLLLLGVLVLSVAVPLLVVPVPEAVPEAEPEIDPEALTPALLLVEDDGVIVAELEVVWSVDCVLLVELVDDAPEAASVPEVLVFVSTEQPVTPRARATSAVAPIRLSLFRIMVCFQGLELSNEPDRVFGGWAELTAGLWTMCLPVTPDWRLGKIPGAATKVRPRAEVL